MLRLTETACLLMLSVFLVSRPSFDHYLVVVLPLLVASAALPGAAARSPWFWLALVPQVPGFTWPFLELPTRRAFKDAVTLCVLTAAVALHRPPDRLRQSESGFTGGADARAVAGGGVVER
ncbi:hypothetical protein [Streptomyces spongiae]|uniref:DUF2029 domain-containing protein n=1 Tax=Streptomyces spongiae TaxID=565072 RepID=A0A5N8XHP3_9ACTN|nr:hypothetical protein [Streptomyces spongiae]